MNAESLSAKISAAYGMTKKSAHMRHFCTTRIQISSATSQLEFRFLPPDHSSYLDFFLLISFMYAAVIMPDGRAMTATPTRADIIVMNLPRFVVG